MHQPSNISSRHETRGVLKSGRTDNTEVAGGGSVNTKGSWFNLEAVTSFAYEALTVSLYSGGDASPSVIDAMLDIAIGDGASRVIIIPDLYCPFRKLVREQGYTLTLPIHVPEGSQLSARVATHAVGESVNVSVIGHASGLGGAPGFSRVITLFTPSSSRGVAIDPGGTANTLGSWTQLASGSAADIGGMFGLLGYNADTARTASAKMLLDIGIGASGFESVIYPRALVCWGATRDGPSNGVRIPPFACSVPSNTRVVARAQCSDNVAGDRTVDLALYGLVP